MDERVILYQNNFILLADDTENISNEIVVKIIVKMPLLTAFPRYNQNKSKNNIFEHSIVVLDNKT